jgi:hypothetical protein
MKKIGTSYVAVAYLLMGLYVILLIVGILFNLSLVTTIASSLAIASFLYIQLKDSRSPHDEREKFILERSSSASFMLLISSLILGAMLNDFVGFLNFVSLEEIFQILIGLGFMTFVSMYVYYSEKI